MKDKEAQELAESIGVLVEKILKLVLRDKDEDDDDTKKGSPD